MSMDRRDAELERIRMSAIFDKHIIGKVLEVTGVTSVNDIPAQHLRSIIQAVDQIAAIAAEIKTGT